jgi:hypothetical protein
MKFKRSALSAILIFPSIFALDYSLEGQSDTIHFYLTHYNHLVIKALLNESDSVNLMFHTAAQAVSLMTEEAARQKSIIWDSVSNERHHQAIERGLKFPPKLSRSIGCVFPAICDL